MKVNGEDFLRNVHIEHDKAKLEQEKEKLNTEKVQSINKTYVADTISTPYDDMSLQSDTVQNDQLQDVILPQLKSGIDRKKFILLGFIIVIVFIVTIVVTRIVSNKSQEDKLNNIPKVASVQKIEKEKILDKIEDNEDYAKVIQKEADILKKKKLDIEKPKIEEKKVITKKPKKVQEIQLPEPIKEVSPVVIQKPKKVKPKQKDLFNISKQNKEQKNKKIKKEKYTKKAIQKQIPHKKIVVPSPKVVDLDKKYSKKLSGYYIQIAALTKKPSSRYLLNIKKKGYNYALYNITIKGKKYNKILIGAYPTKAHAKKVLNNVKKVFNNKYAYILKF